MEAADSRVLVVEDSDPMREFIAEFLCHHHEVLLAESAEEGLRLARTASPSVILCDLCMPGKNGLRAMVELKADPATAHIPLVLMTADAGFAGLALDEAMVLTKPFTADELLRVIGRALAGPRR